MYYILYETTNTINGNKYRGVHQTNNLDDGYLGSGKKLVEAIENDGYENFERKILEFCDSSSKMYQLEKEYVNQKWVDSDMTYNLKIGGHGGWDHENFNSDKQRRKGAKGNLVMKELCKIENGKFRQMRIDNGRKLFKRLGSEGKLGNSSGFKGKHHSKETKEKIGSKNSINQQGMSNSQYGTCGIKNIHLNENKKIKKEELEIGISKGGKPGRVL